MRSKPTLPSRDHPGLERRRALGHDRDGAPLLGLLMLLEKGLEFGVSGLEFGVYGLGLEFGV